MFSLGERVRGCAFPLFMHFDADFLDPVAESATFFCLFHQIIFFCVIVVVVSFQIFTMYAVIVSVYVCTQCVCVTI